RIGAEIGDLELEPIHRERPDGHVLEREESDPAERLERERQAPWAGLVPLEHDAEITPQRARCPPAGRTRGQSRGSDPAGSPAPGTAGHSRSAASTCHATRELLEIEHGVPTGRAARRLLDRGRGRARDTCTKSLRE